MPKGFLDNSDPEVEAGGEFPQVPAGNYMVSKIELFEAESGFPEFVEDGLQRRVGRLRFISNDGIYQIPASFERPMLLLVAHAYGVNIKPLAKIKNETEFLVKWGEAINKSEKSVLVTVNDSGWVSRVRGAHLPEGYYTWKLVRARSFSGAEPIQFEANDFSKVDGKEDPARFSLRLFFEVVGDMLGHPTPFDGASLSVTLNQPFDGKLDGIPKMRVNPNTSKPVSVRRLEKLIQAFCPEMFEYEWQQDNQLSEYGIDEAANPIVVIVDKAIKNGKTAIGHAGLTKKGNIALDLLTLSVEAPDEDEEEDIEIEVQKESEEKTELHWVLAQTNLALFCEWIYKQVDPNPFVIWPPDKLEDLKLSESGQKWAGEFLGDIWVKADLQPEKRAINSLKEDEAEKLCVAAGIKQPENELKFE